MNPRSLFAAALLAVALLAPGFADDHLLGLMVTMAIYSVVTMAWNLIFGYGGVFAFGQLGFFAIGGYGSALAAIHLSVAPWPGLLFGGLVAGLAGAAVGVPSLRLYGPYMILFTLAFQLVLAALLPTVWTDTLGGSGGLFGVPLFAFGDADSLTVAYYAGIGMVLATYVVIALVLRSPMGLGIRGLKEGRAQSEARGISLFQHRVILFTLSAFLTGVAGAFYAHQLGLITPEVLKLNLLVNLLAFMVIGGLGTKFGPIVGVVVGVYVTDTLAQSQEYSQLLFGLILIGVIAIAPGGIVGTAASLGRWLLDLVLASVKKDRERPPMPDLSAPMRTVTRWGAGLRPGTRSQDR